MLTVTDAAINRIRDLMVKNQGVKALRVGVRGGGCSGFSYVFDFDREEPKADDKVFDFNDVKLYVDKKSYFFLNNTELDFVEELMGQRFKFNNPNVTSTCGCGESVSF